MLRSSRRCSVTSRAIVTARTTRPARVPHRGTGDADLPFAPVHGADAHVYGMLIGQYLASKDPVQGPPLRRERVPLLVPWLRDARQVHLLVGVGTGLGPLVQQGTSGSVHPEQLPIGVVDVHRIRQRLEDSFQVARPPLCIALRRPQ